MSSIRELRGLRMGRMNLVTKAATPVLVVGSYRFALSWADVSEFVTRKTS